MLHLFEFLNMLKFCLNQWEMFVTADSGEYLKCCCSHDILCLNFYQNVLNNNVLMIGSDCINKFTKDTKIHNDYKLYSKIFRKCAYCNRKTLVTEIIGNCCQDCQLFKQSNNQPSVWAIPVSKCPPNPAARPYRECTKCSLSNNPDIIIIKADITSNDITCQVKSLLLNYKKICTKCDKEFYSDKRDDCIQCLERQRQEELKKTTTRTQKAKTRRTKTTTRT